MPLSILSFAGSLMGEIGAKLSKKTGVPLVITEHTTIMNEKTIPSRLMTCARKGYSLASNLIERKRPEMLLRAFLELAEVREDIYLGIIGDGNLKKKLQLIVLKS